MTFGNGGCGEWASRLTRAGVGGHDVVVTHHHPAVHRSPRIRSGFARTAVDVWTVGVNNTRQGWNKFETVLTPANVPRLKKIREFAVDEKIDVSPLVVGDKLYVFTMTNTAFVFDVNTGAQLATRQLAAPFDPPHRQPPGQMDRWNIYRNWGITATPVIDVATNTLYVTTFGKPNADSQNTERNNMLWILDANTLADKKPPVLIAGNADNGGGAIANGFTTPYQKMRAGLGLLTDAGGNKAVVISFSINGENPRGPGHGFVVAYDVRGLNRDAGFTPTPAIWNVTPGGGAGGVWMSGSGPAIDGNDIYLATGNGMDPGTMPGNFGESFVKLRYTAGVAGVDNGKPKLAVADFWGAFSDFGRAGRGPGPRRRRRRPHPRARQPHRRRQGRHSLQPEQGQSREEHLGSPVQPSLRRHVSPQRAERRRGSADDDGGQSELADRQSRSQPARADADAGRAITSTERRCTWSGAKSGILYRLGRERAPQSLQLRLRHEAHHRRSAAKGRSSRRATWTRPAACRADASSSRPTARRRARASSGACTRRRGMRTPRSCTARSSPTTRRPSARRQAEAALSQRREPGEQHGELRQVLHAGRGERKGLRRRRSATRSSSTASERSA